MIPFLQPKSLSTRKPAECGALFRLPITDIRPNPNQPRRTFDPIALQELSTSIAVNGLMQPVVVRPVEGAYELIAGERRWRACSMAGMKEIDAIVMDADAEKSACLALVENLHRRDLHFFEEAESYAALMKLYGLTQEQLADRINRKQSTIANKLRVNRMAPHIKAMIIDANLTERHARALLRLPNEDMQLALLERVIASNYSVKETEQQIDQLLAASDDRPKRNVIHLIRDYRLVINTLKSTVQDLRDAGVDANYTLTEQANEVIVTVSVPK